MSPVATIKRSSSSHVPEDWIQIHVDASDDVDGNEDFDIFELAPDQAHALRRALNAWHDTTAS